MVAAVPHEPLRRRDRIGDANLVSVGLTSRLLDAGGGRQFLSATLGQAYYFEDPRVTLPDEEPTNRASSDVVAELELDAFKNWNARAAYVWTRTRTRPSGPRRPCSTGWQATAC